MPRLLVLALCLLAPMLQAQPVVEPWLEGLYIPRDLVQLEDGRIVAASLYGLRTFSAEGAPLGPLGAYDGVVTAAIQLDDGRVLVAGAPTLPLGAVTLQVFSPDGQSHEPFASSTEYASALAQLADGRILVASGPSGSYRIRAYSPDGDALSDFDPTPRSHYVRGMEQLPDGRVLVLVDSSPGTVEAFAPDGTPLGTIVEGIGNPKSLYSDGDRDRVLVVEDRGLTAYAPDGTFLDVLAPSATSTATVLRRDGTFLANIQFGISAFAPDGSPRPSLVRSFRPEGMSLMRDGNVLVLNDSRRLEVYSPEAELLDTLAVLPYSQYVHVLSDGRIAVQSQGFLRLFSESGEPLGDFGEEVFGDGGILQLPDGRILAGGWAFDPGVPIRAFASDGTPLPDFSTRFSPLRDPGMALLSRDRVGFLVEGASTDLVTYSVSGEYLGPLVSDLYEPRGLAQLRDGRIVVGLNAGAQTYSEHGEPLGPLAPGVRSWNGLVELPDGRLLVSSRGRIDVVSGVAVAGEEAPRGGVEAQVAPNPFRERTTLTFLLDAPSDVRLTLYDALGREVALLATGPHEAGEHRVEIAADLPAGVYLWRLVAGDRIETGRVTRVE